MSRQPRVCKDRTSRAVSDRAACLACLLCCRGRVPARRCRLQADGGAFAGLAAATGLTRPLGWHWRLYQGTCRQPWRPLAESLHLLPRRHGAVVEESLLTCGGCGTLSLSCRRRAHAAAPAGEGYRSAVHLARRLGAAVATTRTGSSTSSTKSGKISAWASGRAVVEELRNCPCALFLCCTLGRLDIKRLPVLEAGQWSSWVGWGRRGLGYCLKQRGQTWVVLIV